MKPDRLYIALRILRWALALVILEESLRFALSAGLARALATTGLPDFVGRGLAWVEIAAVVLLVIPRLTQLCGRLLIGVLAFAIALHILHGWFDVGALVVYAAAAWAVVAGESGALSSEEQS